MKNNKLHSEMVKAVAQKTGRTQVEVSKIVDAFLCEVSDSVAEGDIVTIRDFGSFRKATRSARQGRNPHTASRYFQGFLQIRSLFTYS